jgi:sialidase-1
MNLKTVGRPFDIARDDALYESFPDLLLTRGGNLLLAYREADAHIPTDSRLILMSSSDRGQTWDQRILLSAQSDALGLGTWNCPRMSQHSDGRIALVADLKVQGDTRATPYDTYLWWSQDDGNTWYGPTNVRCPGFLPDKIIELHNRELIMGLQLRDTSDGREIPPLLPNLIPLGAERRGKPGAPASPVFRRVYQALYRSVDGGRSWGHAAIVARVGHLSLAEGSTVELSNGRLVCYLRENSFKGYPTYVSHSLDGGWTWSAIQETPMRGHRPTAGLTRGGRILVTYRNVGALEGPQPDPFFLADGDRWVVSPRVRTSTLAWFGDPESGASQALVEIEHDTSRALPDFGYSGWVQFPDGEILVVYHHRGEAPLSCIRGCRFHEQDAVG